MQQEKKQSEKQEVERKVKPDVKMQEGPLHAGQAPEMEVQGTVGNHGALRRIGEGVIQAKLKVSQPGDRYEQEADKVAEEVGKLKEGEVPVRPLRESTSSINRNFLNSSEIEKESSESVTLKINSSKGGGHPLPIKPLQEMSLDFGEDLSDVRIHQDQESESLNTSIHAKAFTHGVDIYFNKGEFNPETIEGKKLLSHELSHVLQQQFNTQRSIIQREEGDVPITIECMRFILAVNKWAKTLDKIIDKTADWQNYNWIRIIKNTSSNKVTGWSKSFLHATSENVLQDFSSSLVTKAAPFVLKKTGPGVIIKALKWGAGGAAATSEFGPGVIIGAITGYLVGLVIESFISYAREGYGNFLQGSDAVANQITDKFIDLVIAKEDALNSLEQTEQDLINSLSLGPSPEELNSASDFFESSDKSNKEALEKIAISNTDFADTILHDWILENAKDPEEPNEQTIPEQWERTKKIVPIPEMDNLKMFAYQTRRHLRSINLEEHAPIPQIITAIDEEIQKQGTPNTKNEDIGGVILSRYNNKEILSISGSTHIKDKKLFYELIKKNEPLFLDLENLIINGRYDVSIKILLSRDKNSVYIDKWQYTIIPLPITILMERLEFTVSP